MTEFINWTTLGTYGGALAMVMVLTQFTKNLSFAKKIPTQIWSYILAFVVMTCAYAFTSGITLNGVFQTIFNAVIVSIAANGGYTGLQKITGKATSGQLLVDTSDPDKDIYRLDVGSLDDLIDKNTVTLAVKAVTNLGSKS